MRIHVTVSAGARDGMACEASVASASAISIYRCVAVCVEVPGLRNLSYHAA